MLTVGTDAKTMLKIKGVKLLPSHDYAVVGELTKVISGLGHVLSKIACSQMVEPRYSRNGKRTMVNAGRFYGACD